MRRITTDGTGTLAAARRTRLRATAVASLKSGQRWVIEDEGTWPAGDVNLEDDASAAPLLTWHC